MRNIFTIFFLMYISLHANAQVVYNEEGKYYEFGSVDYGKSGAVGRMNAASAYFECPSTQSKDGWYRDENGKLVLFKNFASCINFFMLKGWTVLDIHTPDNFFFVRREISKEEAEKLKNDCIKD